MADLTAPLSSRPVYIVGAAETALGEVFDQTELSMVALAAREALGEAGLRLADVDGLFVNYMGEQGSVQVGEYLGIQPRYADSSDLGGAAFEAFVHHAMLAVAAGRCEVALIAYASRQRSKRSRRLSISSSGSGAYAPDPYHLTDQFQAPYGMPMPIGPFALVAARHMHEYGTTREQLAEVAVAASQWAELNPKAWRRTPLSRDDVLDSRPISEPLHRHDCCLVTDGGGAIVVTHRDRARDAAKTPIRVLGAGESHAYWHVSEAPSLTRSAGYVAAAEAFGMAGLMPADADFLEVYDAFTINVITHLEELGLCAPGEGGPMIEGGALRPGGTIPAMTSGGGLSYCHPGALGLLLLVEAVRQLRGECGARQLPEPRIGVCHGMGGVSVRSTVVLGRE